MNKQQLTEDHSFISEVIFRLKVFVLRTRRGLQNIINPTRVFRDEGLLHEHPVIAASESDLWNPHDNDANRILTAGKIENLRIAVQKIQGLEVRAHETFSFWKHIGKPSSRKGYVLGREIREGCLVPTVAGGLCQLSNMLYDAAIKANFEIIERHRHSKVIRGSLAEQDRDATVKWNYIDLRFRASIDFRIEAELTSEKLIIRFKGIKQYDSAHEQSIQLRASNKLNDCFSCGNVDCFNYSGSPKRQTGLKRTTFILDERWREYDEYVQSITDDGDHFILPLKKNAILKTDRYHWTAAQSNKSSFTQFASIYRALRLRLHSTRKNNVFEIGLQLDKKIALAAARKIPIETTHIVVSQNLLPYIYESGALGGRTFDVMMTRLPFSKMHERLDQAFLKHPESPTLKDFRAKESLVNAEAKALTQARKIITPHAEIAELFKNKVIKLNWAIPNSSEPSSNGKKILFPASVVGRKGAYDVRALAQELQFDLVVSGRTIEHPLFWQDLHAESFDGDYSSVGLVLYPTIIENQPRQILKALSKGKVIITTKACGIDSTADGKVIIADHYDDLKAAVKSWMVENQI